MIREEQIVKRAEEVTSRFSYRNGYSTAKDAFIEGAKWADANQPSPWISVEDKLPNDGEIVIVAHRWILGEILYASDVFHIDFGWESYEDVVAWMPIPELES